MQIVPNHRLAQKAILAVCTVLTNAGALTETIENDYGEDLLVQTQLGDVADNFHILIQVKGSRLKETTDGKYGYRFDVAHLQRWVSHPLPVLVCVFDEATGKIFAFYPRQLFSSWFLATTTRKRLSVKLRTNDLFDETSARRFIWACRLELISRTLSWHENRLWYTDGRPYARAIRREAMKEVSLLMLTFLKAFGIILKDDEFSTEFRERIRNCSNNFGRTNKEDPDNTLGLRSAFMLCLLATVDSIAQQGLPDNLIQNATNVAGHLFKTYHREEWLSAGKAVGDTQWLTSVDAPRSSAV